MKTDGNDELIAAIRETAGGRRVISPEIARLANESLPVDELTEHQRQVLELITRGYSNREIAKFLRIREDSVKKLTNVVFSKIGASNRAEAVAIALRKHLLKI